ncbi:MAG: DUF3786 domain-containing protein [Candidatus Bathyarchaeia archaeon]
MWNWNLCKSQIRSLRGRLGFPDKNDLRFLGLRLCLDDGSVYDELGRQPLTGWDVTVYFVLCGYANAKAVPETAKLVSFGQLVGGSIYYKAFVERSIQPLAKIFGPKPQALIKAAKLLGGTPQAYGEYSVKVHSLPLVPLTVILWAENEEFSASANILFDSNANSFLTTEELAGLGGLTSARLGHALEIVKASL